MTDEAAPREVGSSAGLGPVGWRYVPSEVWGDQVLTQDPKTAQLARDMGRDVEPLYTEAQMLARVAAERERWVGYCASMALVKRGESLSLNAEMHKMAAAVNAEILRRSSKA